MPLHACGGERMNVFSARARNEEFTSWGVKDLGDSRVLVVMELRIPGQSGSDQADAASGVRYEYVVRAGGRYPIIEREVYWPIEQGKYGLPSPKLMSKFVELAPGVFIATRVVSLVNRIDANRPPLNAEHGPTFYFVRLWESDDLGKRPPAVEDFVIRIVPGAKVWGYAEANQVSFNVTRFDPNKLIRGRVQPAPRRR